MNTYDLWGTHVPALATAVVRYGFRVLEIGAGWYSTPLLHAMSSQVQTLELEPTWAAKFDTICRGQIHVAPDILAAAKQWAFQDWDVVFVDCDPVSVRADCVELFLDRRICVVIHDSEVANYTELLKRVKYQKHFNFMMPRTSYLSNVLDVTV